MTPKFDCGLYHNQVWDAEIRNAIEVFLTRTIIPKDNIPECKNARLKKPIIIDTYI